MSSAGEEIGGDDGEGLADTIRLKNPLLSIWLTFVPQVIPFAQRLTVFQSLLNHLHSMYSYQHPDPFQAATRVRSSFSSFHSSFSMCISIHN